MKKANLLILSLFVLCLLPLSTKAFTIKSGDKITLDDNETIKGNLYIGANDIQISNKIIGDIFCAGNNININAEVEGDIICAGNSININGDVKGSIRVAGNNINIKGNIEKNVQTIGSNINLNKETTVGWEMFILGNNVQIDGEIKGTLHGNIANLKINKKIGKNVDVKLHNPKSYLEINDNAVIEGDLIYASNNQAQISQKAKIKGEIKKSEFLMPKEKRNIFSFFDKIITLFSYLVTGLVLITLFKKAITKIIKDEKIVNLKTFGWGFTVLFLAPIIVIILAITIIGVPVALILLILWFIALYLSKIICAVILGKIVFIKLKKEITDNLLPLMTVGIFTMWLIFQLPIIGPLCYFLAILLGLGIIFLNLKNNYSK